jgi:hypothetical protein
MSPEPPRTHSGPRAAATVAVALLGLLLAWLALAPREARLPNATPAHAAEPEPRAKGVTGPAVEPWERRRAADAPVAAAAREYATPDYAFELVAHDRDEHGLSRNHGLHFGPEDGSLLGYSGGFERLAEHEQRYRWTGTRPRAVLVVGATLLRRVAIESGRPLRLANGEFLSPPSPVPADPLAAEFGPDAPSTIEFGATLAPAAPFVMVDEGLVMGGTVMGFPALTRRDPKYGVLGGLVTTPTGEPARAFVVRVVGGKKARVAADGTFEFEPMLTGTYTIEAGDENGATARATIPLLPGNSRCNLRLVPAPAVRGRVVDLAGQPVANARLVWWTDDGDYQNRVVSKADGGFRVPVRAPGRGTLWACVPGDGARWPLAGATAHTDAGDIALVVDRGACRGSLRMPLPFPRSIDPRTIAARLWQTASGLGMPLVRVANPERPDDECGDWVALHLPAGHYTLELSAPAFGAVAAGAFWCDGASPVALPRLELPPLCAVTFALRAGAHEPSAFELVRTGGAFASRLHDTRGIKATRHLAAGDYELWWRHGATAPAQSLSFCVPRGATELAVPLP